MLLAPLLVLLAGFALLKKLAPGRRFSTPVQVASAIGALLSPAIGAALSFAVDGVPLVESGTSNATALGAACVLAPPLLAVVLGLALAWFTSTPGASAAR